MNFGIALPTPADSWKTVKRAEDAGFSTAWFYDTPAFEWRYFRRDGCRRREDRPDSARHRCADSFQPYRARSSQWTCHAERPRPGPYRCRFRDRLHRSAEYGPRAAQALRYGRIHTGGHGNATRREAGATYRRQNPQSRISQSGD